MPTNICASSVARIGRNPYVGSERCLSWADEPDTQCLCACLAAGVDIELSQDCRDVMSNRLLGHHQVLGYLRVALTLGEQPEHLQLAGGEAGGVLARARTRPAR